VEYLESRRLLTAIAEYSVTSNLYTAHAPDGITAGANGNLWFTDNSADQIGEINSATGKIVDQIQLPTGSHPFQITLGPDKNIWFTEPGADAIGMINPTTGVYTPYPLQTPNASPYGITAGPNDTIWFTEWEANQIGMINLATNKVSEFPNTTGGTVPEGITLGPGGNIWFTDSLGNGTASGMIGMINATTDVFSPGVTVPTNGAEPDGITVAPDGNLWFTEYAANQIGTFDPKSGAFSEFSIPASNTKPTEIAVGPDGNIWFTQSGTSQIGMLNLTTKTVTEFNTPTPGSGPRGIATGPDGRVWFAELNSGKIGVVEPELVVAPPTELDPGSGFGVTVTVGYGSGDVDTGYSGSVNISLANGPAGGELGGTVNATVVNGVATFNGLSLNQGGGYTLQVSSEGAAASLAVPLTVMSAANPPPGGHPITIAPPTITGEHVFFAGKGKRKHLVFQLVFSSPLDPSSAGNSGNYTVTQSMKHGREKIAQAIRLQVDYNAAAKTVNLIIEGKPHFTNGGQLIVNAAAPTGITGTTGVYVDGNAIFTVLPGGRGIAG